MHGLTHTTPLIDEAIGRAKTRLKTTYPQWDITDGKLIEGLTSLALYQDSVSEAIRVLDASVPDDVNTALMFY